MTSRHIGLAGLVAAALLAACASVPAPRPVPPVHLESLVEQGDARRRASLRLVLEGLERDAAARPGPAMASYERALQVDSTNPYVFLAVARHHVESAEPARALPFLDKADALLRAEQASPGAEAHLLGLRGATLRATGQRDRGEALLEQARLLAPEVWSDGRLAAHELR